MEILSVVSVITSCIVSVVHAIIAYRKSKEPPKDEVWEAALQITLNESGGLCTPDVQKEAPSARHIPYARFVTKATMLAQNRIL